MSRRYHRSRRRGSGGRKALLVVIVALALVAAAAPAGSFTLGQLPRPYASDVVTDGDGVVAYSISPEVGVGSTEWLVNITNNYDQSLSVTVTLDASVTSFADLVVNGTNQGDSHTFTLASAGTQTVEVQIASDCSIGGSTLPFDVEATTTGFTSTVNRSSAVAAGGTRNSLAYHAQSDNNLRMIERDGTVSNVGIATSGFGPPDVDFDCDGKVEIPYVDGSGAVKLVDADGQTQTLASGALTGALLGVGDYDGDGNPAVFYTNNTASGLIYKVEYGGSPTDVTGGNAKGDSVLGIADFNNDGDMDIVYSDNRKITYWDNNAETDTGVQSTSITQLGPPRDYDGNGVPRVPVVEKKGDIWLVDSNGNTETIYSAGDTAAGHIAGFDWDDDGAPDIVMVSDADNKLYWIDYATGTRTGPIQDDGGVDVVTNGQGAT